MTEHVLDLYGEGHFSRGSCTGCGWQAKGHADDIRRQWAQQHPTGPDATVTALPLPKRVDLPEMVDDPLLRLLEARIIVLLTHKIDFQQPQTVYVALGLAEARAYRRRQLSLDIEDPSVYVSALMARVASLSRRQREKLRHPTRTREEQQIILEDG